MDVKTAEEIFELGLAGVLRATEVSINREDANPISLPFRNLFLPHGPNQTTEI